MLTPSSCCLCPPDCRDGLECEAAAEAGCACVVEAFDTMETSPLASPGAVVEDVDFRGAMTFVFFVSLHQAMSL